MASVMEKLNESWSAKYITLKSKLVTRKGISYETSLYETSLDYLYNINFCKESMLFKKSLITF